MVSTRDDGITFSDEHNARSKLKEDFKAGITAYIFPASLAAGHYGGSAVINGYVDNAEFAKKIVNGQMWWYDAQGHRDRFSTYDALIENVIGYYIGPLPSGAGDNVQGSKDESLYTVIDKTIARPTPVFYNQFNGRNFTGTRQLK